MEKKYLNDSGLMQFWGRIKSYTKSVSDDLQGQINDKQQQITANDKDIETLQNRSTQMEQSINNIAVTGGASVANTVTYSNTASGLVSINAQGAIDELAAKNATKAEKAEVTAELAKKFDKESILQESGDSEDKVMSQKAVSDKLSDLESNFIDYFEEGIIGKYIGANGVLETLDYAISTQYIKVSEGDSLHFIGGFQNSGAEALGLVWGYTDEAGNGAVKLVNSYSLYDDDFIITQGVNYIRAWSLISKNPSLVVSNSVKHVTNQNANNITKISTKLDTVSGVVVEHENEIKQITEEVSDTNTKLDELEIIIGKDYFEEGIIGKYIGANGVLETLDYAISTQYIKVSEGDSLHFIGGFQNSGAEALGLVWGYTDEAGNGAVKLVNSYSLYDDDFIITQGVNYIRAWSLISKNPSIYSNKTIEVFVSENKPKIDYAYKFAKENSPTIVEITATRNAANFNSIREIINSITDASSEKRYIIHVPVGEWFECDIQGKDYVSIIGEDRERTILYCDGLSDNVTPSDYSYAANANTALNAVSKIYKHVFFAKKNLIVRNLSVKALSCKYCLHLDQETYTELLFDNCHFYGTNLNNIIGIGIHAGQHLRFENCIIENLDALGYGVFCHNDSAQSKPTNMEFENCYFKSCHIISMMELGSNKDDNWKVLNCYSSFSSPQVKIELGDKGNNTSYWKNADGVYETDPSKVPYFIKSNFLGTNVKKIVHGMWGGVDSRPNAEDYIIANFREIVE